MDVLVVLIKLELNVIFIKEKPTLSSFFGALLKNTSQVPPIKKDEND